MKTRRLRLYGDPILLAKSIPVVKIDDNVEELVLDMIDTVKKYGGIGIAAPQLGESLRVIVIKTPDQEKIIINPVIQNQSDIMVKSIEGCLSLPGVIHEVDRPSWVEISYMDIEGNHLEYELLKDMESCVFFHEFDHLEGRLLTFHMSSIHRSLATKKLRSINKYNDLLTKSERT